ncbi:MAG: response regulator [Dehalococcoidia bacterium]|nr:response regulator [Dehalococcoidia bacterium]
MARNLSALVVDPNLDSRLDTSRSLESVGLDLAGESSYGTEATVMAAEHKPNVILLALEDPPARGVSTLESLQTLAPDTPVIVYSSSGNVDLVRQAMRAGARDFLSKPLQAQALRETIHNVLAQEEQRQLARWGEQSAVTARGTVITVAGAKGGIGKSTLTTNLAIAIRQVTGQEVALVDGDAQFGDVSVMLDLDATHSIADLARNEPEITRESVLPYLNKHHSGVNVLLATSEPDDWRALQPQHISSIARALAETHEFVIFDTPGTMNEVVAASLNEASMILIVTSLDVSSVKDTRTAMRILDAWAFARSRVRLIVNDNNRAAGVTAEDVSRATGMPVTAHLQYEARVGVAVQTGLPIVQSDPRSRYARSVIELAENITGVGSEKRLARRSAFGRLSLFGKAAS